MKIDSLNTQYELPGFEIAPKAFDPEEAEDDFRDAPYGLDSPLTPAPAPGGWQQLLGLRDVSPTPITIDPPQRHAGGEWKTKATAAYRTYRDDNGKSASSSASSLNVRRMLAMLAQTRQEVATIRARAMETT